MRNDQNRQFFRRDFGGSGLVHSENNSGCNNKINNNQLRIKQVCFNKRQIDKWIKKTHKKVRYV